MSDGKRSWKDFIEFPVRFTKDFDIIDNANKTVIPCMLFRSDVVHVERTKILGNFLARLINESRGLDNDALKVAKTGYKWGTVPDGVRKKKSDISGVVEGQSLEVSNVA